MRISVEIAPGDLFDRLSILSLKMVKIKDRTKLCNIKREFESLNTSAATLYSWMQEARKHEKLAKLQLLVNKLQEINTKIWDIEDKIRGLEQQKKFDHEFIEVARSVYYTNDERAAIKREIDLLLGSDIVEEKSYTDYK